MGRRGHRPWSGLSRAQGQDVGAPAGPQGRSSLGLSPMCGLRGEEAVSSTEVFGSAAGLDFHGLALNSGSWHLAPVLAPCCLPWAFTLLGPASCPASLPAPRAQAFGARRPPSAHLPCPCTQAAPEPGTEVPPQLTDTCVRVCCARGTSGTRGRALNVTRRPGASSPK